MKFKKKVVGVLTLGALLSVSAVGMASASQIEDNTKNTELSDKEFYANYMTGLNNDELDTYVSYLDEIDKLSDNINDLYTEEGEILAGNREQHDKLYAERERLEKEVYLLEKKDWGVFAKERVQSFKDMKEDLRQSLLNDVTKIMEIETKLIKEELTEAEKDMLNEELDNTHRHFNGEIFFFDKSEEIEKMDALTTIEKNKLLDSYMKVNALTQKIAHLTYDERYQIVPEDKETYKKLDDEITAIYINEIDPLEKKAGVWEPLEKLRW